MMKERVMKRTLIFAALLVAGFAAFQASASAQGKYGHGDRHGANWQGSGGRHRHDGDFGGGLSQLNLSQSQKDRIAKIRESHQKDLIDARADLQKARLEFRSLLSDDKPDKGAINRQIDRMASIQADIMKSRVDQRLDVRDVLTSDQRTKLREGRKERGDVQDEAPNREEDPRRP
jgi:Spy/CpxP family protein refolding chaperone